MSKMLVLSACSVLLLGCQAGTAGPERAFDGLYRGERRLLSGFCSSDAPTPLAIRIRNGRFRSGDGGLAFEVDHDGELSSRGAYLARGHVVDGHLELTLQGIGSRGCLYGFDLHRVNR